MRLITQNTDYAIRALCCLARKKDEIISAAQLSDELNISWNFLRRVLQKLNKKGLVRSYKGKGGGFKLKVPPHRIFILELMKTFQGILQFDKCMVNEKTCSNIEECKLRIKIKEIEDYVVSELKPVTIDSLMPAGKFNNVDALKYKQFLKEMP